MKGDDKPFLRAQRSQQAEVPVPTATPLASCTHHPALLGWGPAKGAGARPTVSETPGFAWLHHLFWPTPTVCRA